jgi:hypothetical protein
VFHIEILVTFYMSLLSFFIDSPSYPLLLSWRSNLSHSVLLSCTQSKEKEILILLCICPLFLTLLAWSSCWSLSHVHGRYTSHFHLHYPIH